MKKLLKLTPLVFTLCFIPIFISAGTFEDGKNIANKYMKNNFEEDYSKYIISENTKYGFSEEGIFSVSGFNKGGLINKYEFDISKTNSDDSSWLYDMNGYWSLTGDNDNAYVIGKSAYPKTDIYKNRIVEYVRNKTRVTGKGTYSNPWVIDKSYQVIIKANREKLINSIYINNNKCGEDRCETNIIMNRDAVFYINFKDGYEYDTSEEGANLCNAAGYSPTLKKLVISNVVNDVECFFKVKEKEYEITFNANGGTLTGKNIKKVTYTKSYGTLPEPTREGYGFAGWYTEQVNGNRIDSSSILDTPEAKTLYAHWNPKSYTVIFDGNNGTPSYSNKTVVYDTNYGTLPTASRTGYSFLGWYTTASGGTQVTNNTTVKINSTQTLYARWTANTYVVTLLKNDGTSNSAGTVSVTYNSKYGNLASVSRTGYIFDGWYTSVTGGTKITSDTIMTTASNHTLYAHWTENSHKTEFYVGSTLISSTVYTTGARINYPTKATIASKIYSKQYLPDRLNLGGTTYNWYDIMYSNVSFSQNPTVQPSCDLRINITMNQNSCVTIFGKGRSKNARKQLEYLRNSSYGSLYSKYCNAIDGARTLECIANCDIVYILYSKSWSILPSCNDSTSKNGYSEYRSFGVIDGVGIEENRSCNGYF